MDVWQLVSVNINRQQSLDISTIKEILGPADACTHSLAILSIQETESYDVPNLELPGYVWYGGKSGFATLMVSEQFCTIKRSWKFEERCAAILFVTTMVMAVYALGWRCMRPASRVSSEYFEQDAEAEPKTSTLQETTMWNWG